MWCFKDKFCVIYDSVGTKLFPMKMEDKRFSLDWIQTESCAFPSLVDQFKLWHKRLGHFHYSALNYIK